MYNGWIGKDLHINKENNTLNNQLRFDKTIKILFSDAICLISWCTVFESKFSFEFYMDQNMMFDSIHTYVRKIFYDVHTQKIIIQNSLHFSNSKGQSLIGLMIQR